MSQISYWMILMRWGTKISKQQVQSSFNKVEGGELEIIRMEKFAGMDALVKNKKCFNC